MFHSKIVLIFKNAHYKKFKQQNKNKKPSLTNSTIQRLHTIEFGTYPSREKEKENIQL